MMSCDDGSPPLDARRLGRAGRLVLRPFRENLLDRLKRSPPLLADGTRRWCSVRRAVVPRSANSRPTRATSRHGAGASPEAAYVCAPHRGEQRSGKHLAVFTGFSRSILSYFFDEEIIRINEFHCSRSERNNHSKEQKG